MKDANKKNFFQTIFSDKKYRPLLISAGLFLCFDLGVLIPNYVFSTLLKKDAVSINLAGRQRMLSQKMTKSLLEVKNQQEAGSSFKESREELKKAYELFDDALDGFGRGKSVQGADGEPVYLPVVDTEKKRAILDQALAIWTPYKEKLQPILKADESIQFKDLEAAVEYARENNLKLLSLMNQLTIESEQVAQTKTGYLQLIQLIGMTLALGNFFILLSRSFKRMQIADQEIETANAQILQLNERLQADNIRLKSELDATRRLQQMILPKSSELESVEGLDIAGYMEPADEVGGDYYDVLNLDGNVKIGIGDVTGHGLESGMLMLMVQTAVRTLQEVEETNPVRFMDILNRTIYKNIQRMDSGKNLTLSLIDYSDGELKLSGQHEEVILARSNGEVELLDTTDLGFPIGLDDEIADFVDEQKIKLDVGDVAVLFTDGITEAEDIHKNLYGIEKLCEVIKQNRHLSASEIKDAVIEDVRSHIGLQQVFDDITLLVLKQKDTGTSLNSLQSQSLATVGI
ncbi:serine phosphatase RsbU, regulator of sigma subunit [Rivularia sp. PCC 7116]|uniref:PP2C family protein-serine/threonine phosphatase n=1 Tax=Rivularia sp. PCC 7116 TaxID=373994 RepID=UPI00029F11DA|nr:SpoIIE family protein phosphatase [Rivularia sp. PCC 7116]AFY54971.1 serine phosphatase RsbU, regulator of sigma subunit [Rivularia sp. PCC 7116]